MHVSFFVRVCIGLAFARKQKCSGQVTALNLSSYIDCTRVMLN